MIITKSFFKIIVIVRQKLIYFFLASRSIDIY